jgi:hypothetical protein
MLVRSLLGDKRLHESLEALTVTVPFSLDKV